MRGGWCVARVMLGLVTCLGCKLVPRSKCKPYTEVIQCWDSVLVGCAQECLARILLWTDCLQEQCIS